MKWAAKEVARNKKPKEQKGKFNPRSIASPQRLKREGQRRVKFADNIVASTQKRPTTDDEKRLFTTKADEERAKRDKYMCLDLLEYKKEYKQQ